MEEQTWSIYRQVHIVPNNDIKVHDMVGKCWCHPKIDWYEKVMNVIHDALDGRIIAEKLIEEVNAGN